MTWDYNLDRLRLMTACSHGGAWTEERSPSGNLAALRCSLCGYTKFSSVDPVKDKPITEEPLDLTP